MSTSTHPIIILSDSNVEDAVSSTNTPDYTPASPDYSPTSPGNTSHFHDDPYMKDFYSGDHHRGYPGIMDMINNQGIENMIPPIPPRDTKPPVRSPISLSPSSSVGSSSPVRSTTPPPDYPFDESIFPELDNLLWIIPRPLKSEPVPEKPNKTRIMAPKRTSTSAAPPMTQAAIKKLVADSVAAALEAQAATMANTDNTTRNTR
ncbi:hypothetical protein Tco_0015533 [Tanacetum coccineum]